MGVTCCNKLKETMVAKWDSIKSKYKSEEAYESSVHVLFNKINLACAGATEMLAYQTTTAEKGKEKSKTWEKVKAWGAVIRKGQDRLSAQKQHADLSPKDFEGTFVTQILTK